jgi:hypothetical protein
VLRILQPGQPRQCVKNFPKDFQEETIVREDGYPLYRRRPGRTFKKNIRGREVELDNRWIVPYNPYLTKRYKAHINVEVCGSVKAIKYIHKYIYKGADRATIRVEDRMDEITMTLNGRVISPSMALWNLYSYKRHEEKPAVKSLSFHLEGYHRVHFDTSMTAEQLQMAAEQQRSEFTAWMDYNRIYNDGNLRLLY